MSGIQTEHGEILFFFSSLGPRTHTLSLSSKKIKVAKDDHRTSILISVSRANVNDKPESLNLHFDSNRTQNPPWSSSLRCDFEIHPSKTTLDQSPRFKTPSGRECWRDDGCDGWMIEMCIVVKYGGLGGQPAANDSPYHQDYLLLNK
jgi:hypothetical protein